MKKTRFTESQIVKALKEEESGRSVADISRELGINKQTFYNWKKKYSGMDSQVYPSVQATKKRLSSKGHNALDRGDWWGEE